MKVSIFSSFFNDYYKNWKCALALRTERHGRLELFYSGVRTFFTPAIKTISPIYDSTCGKNNWQMLLIRLKWTAFYSSEKPASIVYCGIYFPHPMSENVIAFARIACLCCLHATVIVWNAWDESATVPQPHCTSTQERRLVTRQATDLVLSDQRSGFTSCGVHFLPGRRSQKPCEPLSTQVK